MNARVGLMLLILACAVNEIIGQDQRRQDRCRIGEFTCKGKSKIHQLLKNSTNSENAVFNRRRRVCRLM